MPQSYTKKMDYTNYIARCIELARLGEYYVAPNPMVGAVLVRNSDETIIGEGWHWQFGQAHAEVNCFADAERKNTVINYKDCTLFVSLEPCSHYGKTPPCAKLIIEKGVGRVVVGMQDPNPQVSGRGIEMLREAGIEVVVGILQKECRLLNKRFLCLQEKKRPYVTLKWAQTADGYVDNCRSSRRDGDALVISTPLTKQIVHRMRAENMAIMVGTRTALLDNPRLLTTRWSGRNPIRITVDRHHILPADSRILDNESETIVYREQTDWTYILQDLASRGIHSVLVEGGPTLLRTIMESGLYDEIHVEVAPIYIRKGVAAPDIVLPATCERIDGHTLYTICHNDLGETL